MKLVNVGLSTKDSQKKKRAFFCGLGGGGGECCSGILFLNPLEWPWKTKPTCPLVFYYSTSTPPQTTSRYDKPAGDAHQIAHNPQRPGTREQKKCYPVPCPTLLLCLTTDEVPTPTRHASKSKIHSLFACQCCLPP